MTHPFYTPEDIEYLDDMVDDVLDHLDMIELAIELAIELDEVRLRTYHMGVAL